MAQTEEFMFQNVAYRPTVYRTGANMHAFLPVALLTDKLFQYIMYSQGKYGDMVYALELMVCLEIVKVIHRAIHYEIFFNPLGKLRELLRCCDLF